MLEAINTAATVATLVVLTVGAIAAAVQLRHMRTSNQLQAFLDIYSRAQTHEMALLFRTALHDLPKLCQDPEYMKQWATGSPLTEGSPLRLAFWFDEVGVALREGLVQEHLMFQVGASADTTVTAWRNMRPIIDAVRKRAPSAFIHFEYAAVRARQWLERHPNGDFPHGTPRWEELDAT